MHGPWTIPADTMLGARIREARKAAYLSQAALGREIGVSFQQFQKYESGRNRISATNLAIVAKVTGRPVGWFLAEEPVLTADEAAELERAVLGVVSDIVARRAVQGEARH